MPWKMGQISPLDHRAGCPGAASRPHLASALQERRKSANIHASSGGIRRIPGKLLLPWPTRPANFWNNIAVRALGHYTVNSQ